MRPSLHSEKSFNFWVLFFNVSSVVPVFINEYCSTIVVESLPEKGLMCEAKNKEITGLRALAEDIRNLFDICV